MKRTKLKKSERRIHLLWFVVCASAIAISFFLNQRSIEKIRDEKDAEIRKLQDAADTTIKKIKDEETKKTEGLQAKLSGIIADAAAKFNNAEITGTFTTEIPVFQAAGIGRLDIGTVESTETFEKSEERKTLWGLISRGETVAEIKVPATYRYHIDLGREWEVSVQDKTCIVKAPPIQASLPVAIQTDRLEKKVSEGWAQFNGEEMIDELQRSITPTLDQYASSEKNISLIREDARKGVARFIRAWLLREEQWNEDKFSKITVIFSDEKIVPEVNLQPTLTLDVLP